ncbi:citrate lyase beta subunit [Mycena floridula]|nr:citrate lyase beta subunit [Mycena floridula]
MPALFRTLSMAFLRQCHCGPARMSRFYSSLRRAYLYVPSSNERMLEKSLSTTSDVLIYDLEDSVAPAAKEGLILLLVRARENLTRFLAKTHKLPASKIAVRVNSISTTFFEDDISEILGIPTVGAIVMPKIHSAEDLEDVSENIRKAALRISRTSPIRIILSIESAKAMWNLRDIASWTSKTGSDGGIVTALLVRAKNYCADTSIIRSSSREELLYTRSQIVLAAKAFKLEAIDMVCVNYKDNEYLKAECQDGRRLGFTGKQAIHPMQVDVIQSTFVPTSQEILRAAKILHQMEQSHAANQGAIGLDGEMVDAPMLKQAESTIRVAKAAGLEIPSLT